MQAETLNCPMCGAATATEAPNCRYCGSRLATISCASCFGLMFLGSKHCPRCGAAASAREGATPSQLECPRCKLEMLALTLGSTVVRECGDCLGLWLDVAGFEKICADREEQAAVLGAATPAPQRSLEAGRITYAPCPQCSQLMNRVNFARCSGVIVDICKGHGTWFDRDELSRIVEFIRAGGLEMARTKEKVELEEERRRLRQEQLKLDLRRSGNLSANYSEESLMGIASAKGLLKLLVD